MRCWCISTSPENWEICKQNSVWGMDERYYVTMEKFLKSGDKAVVYNHGGKFVAVVIFVSDFFYSDKHIGWKKGKNEFLFPYRIKFDICQVKKTRGNKKTRAKANPADAYKTNTKARSKEGTNHSRATKNKNRETTKKRNNFRIHKSNKKLFSEE